MGCDTVFGDQITPRIIKFCWSGLKDDLDCLLIAHKVVWSVCG